MKNLVQLDYQNGIYLTDKQRDHKYLEEYDSLFLPFQNRDINIFEVGYWYGGSCQLWKLYFPNAIIKAIDLTIPNPWDNKSRNANLMTDFIAPKGRVQLFLKDIKKLPSIYFKDFPVDIAIDDGSHKVEDQIYFINFVYPFLKKGGMLIVEDIQSIEKDLPIFLKLKYPFSICDKRVVSGQKDSIFLLFKK